jgi:hypothetical protein
LSPRAPCHMPHVACHMPHVTCPLPKAPILWVHAPRAPRPQAPWDPGTLGPRDHGTLGPWAWASPEADIPAWNPSHHSALESCRMTHDSCPEMRVDLRRRPISEIPRRPFGDKQESIRRQSGVNQEPSRSRAVGGHEARWGGCRAGELVDYCLWRCAGWARS